VVEREIKSWWQMAAPEFDQQTGGKEKVDRVISTKQQARISVPIFNLFTVAQKHHYTPTCCIS